MKKLYLIGFPILLFFDVVSQICFKYASMTAIEPSLDPAWLISLLTKPWIYGALLGYIGSFIAWMSLLKEAPVGPSVAVSHMDLVLVTLISVLIFHEHLNGYKIVGGSLIILGVLFLAKGEAEIARRERAAAATTYFGGAVRAPAPEGNEHD